MIYGDDSYIMCKPFPMLHSHAEAMAFMSTSIPPVAPFTNMV